MEVLNEEARVAKLRVARRRSSNILLCYIQGARWRTGDGGRRVDRKGLRGGKDRTAGFLILIKRVSYFDTETLSSALILYVVSTACSL